MITSQSPLCERIRAAKGERPSDLVLKNCRIVNVFSGEIVEADLAISGETIAALGQGYKGHEEIDIQGLYVLPGLVDAHMHIESTMLTPANLARALVPYGTSTIIADPHEIANVLGINGVRFMLKQSQGIPMDVYFLAPSCVPATDLETSGARLDCKDISELASEDRILGLAEVMNYPGVINCIDHILEKIRLFCDNIVDGHCPGLSGPDLQAYVCAGIGSDHEAITIEEAREKLRLGMMVMIREGTSAENMEALLPLVSPKNSHRFCLVSDDLHPLDIMERGHLNHVLKKAVQLGLDPVLAVRMVTYNPAAYFGLKGRGAVAPGYRANLAVVEDLESFEVKVVLKDGKIVAREGELVSGVFEHNEIQDISVLHSMRVAELSPESFEIPERGARARVMELIPGQITTRCSQYPVKTYNGKVISDLDRDILKIAVVERHRASGRVGLGLVKGFGLKSGAIASSVAHDSHNVIVVGVQDLDMFMAVTEVIKMGGGMVVVEGGMVKSALPLPVAGLISTEPLETISVQLQEISSLVKDMGCALKEPFMCLSFLALPVIPELKLTDLGLVDVKKFQIVPLFF